MTDDIDLHIMKLLVHTPETDVVSNNSTPIDEIGVQSDQVNEIKISPVPVKNETTEGVEPTQMDLAEPRQQAVLPAAPDEEEPAPISRWLYGSPSQEVLQRCKNLNEMSKNLKYHKYE